MAIHENNTPETGADAQRSRERELESMCMRLMGGMRNFKRLAAYQMMGVAPLKLAEECAQTSDQLMRDAARVLVPQSPAQALRNRP